MEHKLSLAELFILALAILTITLLIGTMGFRYWVGLDWASSFHNAVLHATGLGPAVELTQPQDQIFSAIYALISVTVFVGIVVFFVSRVVADTFL